MKLPVGHIDYGGQVGLGLLQLVQARGIIKNGGGIIGFSHKGVALGHGPGALLCQGETGPVDRGGKTPDRRQNQAGQNDVHFSPNL